MDRGLEQRRAIERLLVPRGQRDKVAHVPLAPVAQEGLARMLLEGAGQALHEQDVRRMRAFVAEHAFGRGPRGVSQRGS